MTPEQQALLDKAQRSLEASQNLMEQGFYDFAVSRAYYALFYVAEALLDKEGLSFSSHAAVISAFGQYLARPGKVPLDLHRQLIDAQALRTRADYDIYPNLSKQDAQMLIAQADAFLAIAREVFC
ncbi:HEPN domain-containing protein [Thermoleptolyngbya oregonensis NK1-22]|uniref:HEPN domain-containing protein n=1 Tax=Thermoleptolyngbya oregonensis NK1-22 TaxID=2547457 RepID=A0AA97BAL5_9CYAN|nr:HEPN domain-containing protein [Thermoleptolyngbya oregonensis NK1-22]